MKRGKLLILGAGILFAAAIPAAANIVAIPPEAPPYLINASATGITTLVAIIETPGANFSGNGFTNLDAGWNSSASGIYAEEHGPSSTYLSEVLDVSSSTPTFAMNFFGFSDCALGFSCPAADLADGYRVSVVDWNYAGYTPLMRADFANTQLPVPESTSMGEAITIGILLIGIGGTFQKKRLQQQRR